jgi:Putative peptidoglycan binding domain
MEKLEIGSTGVAVYWLGRNLIHLGEAQLAASSKYDKEMEDAIVRFQTKYGLFSDGEVGIHTRRKLHELYRAKLKSKYGATNGLVAVSSAQADKFKNGFTSFRTRQDVAELLDSIKIELNGKGALLTSAGGIRDLTDLAKDSSMSATSFHYTGRAIDLAVSAGMENPDKDPYIVVAEDAKGREGSRLHRVYARATGGAKMTLKAVTYEEPLGAKSVTDNFVDLTQLMLASGFERIRAKPKFYDTESYSADQRYKSAEWWHFQYQIGLMHGHSTFGGELQLIWPRTQLENSVPWKIGAELIFGESWN